MTKKGTLLLVLGALLIAAALGLCGYNLIEDTGAARADERILEQLTAQLPTPMPATQRELPLQDDSHAEYPDYLIDPTRDMPTIIIDGNTYIGVISIPSQQIELPVLADCSMALLKIAPCHYKGTVYQNNMVIAAHNYSSHFGKLTRLAIGDEVTFTDTEGNVFTYTVRELEIVQPQQTTYMTEGAWDLTLFTCTWGGASRVTVRCDRVTEQ